MGVVDGAADVHRRPGLAASSRRHAASSGAHFYYESITDTLGSGLPPPNRVKTALKNNTVAKALSEGKNHVVLARKLDKMARNRMAASAQLHAGAEKAAPAVNESGGGGGRGGGARSGRRVGWGGLASRENGGEGAAKKMASSGEDHPEARQRFRNRLRDAMSAASVTCDASATQEPPSKEPQNHDVAPARAAAAAAAELNVFNASAVDLASRAEFAESAAAAAAAEVASLRAAISSLESRAAAVERRDAAHQHRLQVFERMEPIFERVAERLRFGSAEEVMERLDTLETACVDFSVQLADAQDALIEERRRADAAEAREVSSQQHEREDDRDQRRAAADAEHAAVREELATTKVGAARGGFIPGRRRSGRVGR